MNVVVTGGGTVAPIDDVRQIANVSSGRFSATITEACLARGAQVWHIHAPGAQLPFLRQAQFDLETSDSAAEWSRLSALRTRWLKARDRLHRVPLESGTVACYTAHLARTLETQSIDITFLAMAVSDYEPEPFPGKFESDGVTMTVHLSRTPKVIRSVRDWAPRTYLVGFKLLSRASEADLIREAALACRINRADLTVANDLQTLRAGHHTVHLVRPDHAPETLAPGQDLAQRLVDRVCQWAEERRAR